MRDQYGARFVLMLGCLSFAFSPVAAQAQTKLKIPALPKDPRPAIKETVNLSPNDAAVITGMFFLWANAPAVPGERGVIDHNSKIGAPTATLWESWKNVSEIYRPDGGTPCDWQTVCEIPGDPTKVPTLAQLSQAFGPADSTWIHFLSENRMIDGQQVVDPKSRVLRYDVRNNFEHFNYVAKNPAGYELFNLDGQQQALADANFQFNFPPEAMEVKACWRMLDPQDDVSPFWTAYGAYYDDQQQLKYARFGLTAIHIISKALPDWFWMTFEQVDIAKNTQRYFLQQPKGPVGPNPTANPLAGPVNQELQKVLAGTKWANYQITGWQSEYTSNGQPTLLANMNIETYFPKTSSCISCHAMANIGPPQMHRLNFWNTQTDGIYGLIGDVDFPAIAKQQAPGLTFKQMDHVWSLRQAQPKASALKNGKGPIR